MAPTLLAGVALLVSACGEDTGAGGGSGTPATPEPAATLSASDPPEVALDFDETGLDLAPGRAELANAGEAILDARVATGGAGSLRTVPGLGSGGAVRFPAYVEGADPDLAVLVLLPTLGDELSPGEEDFEFGLDFALDAESEGGVDNGNNLMQRGLFADPAQYKLQIEKGELSCRILGSAGEVLVKAEAPVDPRAWYRATCRRQGQEVLLSLRSLEQPGEPLVGEWSERGATGAVTMASVSSPLSVGGKVSPQGMVVPGSPDQFNGTIDNVRFRVG